MSSIKLKHASGNGVIIAAPSSNPAADRTLTLPGDADGIIAATDTSGNLGLGVTPTQKLHVNGNILVPSGNNLYFGDTGCKIDGTAGGSMSFMTNSNIAVVIDSSGKFGIGKTPALPLDVVGANDTTFDHVGTLSLQGTDAYNSGNAGAGINFSGVFNSSGSITTLAQISGIKEDTGNGTFDGALTFGVRNDAQGVNIERARIDSAGNLNLDTSSNPLPNNSAALLNMDVPQGKDGVNIKQDSTHHCFNIWRSASDGNIMNFYRGSSQGGSVGIISVNSTSTTYATSSDYRLKENVSAISDGITRLKTLKPYRFNFKVEPSRIVDGFFAHEVSLIVPEAITGIKDEVNENNEPIYQAIDQSKLVPLLTAALQEEIAKREALEARVVALEAK